jgi:hypothetical protein
MVTSGNARDRGLVVQRFLLNPEKNVVALYSLCWRIAYATILAYQRRGYRLPDGPGMAESHVQDLAKIVIEPVLCPKRGRSYGVILDYFEVLGITDYSEAHPVDLALRLERFIRFHGRKGVKIARREDNPAAENLKRAITDTLRGNEYGHRDGYVYLEEYRNELREDRELIDSRSLLDLVSVAYQRHTSANNTRKWCRAIFEELNLFDEFRNCLLEHELKIAVLKCYFGYVDADALWHTGQISPELEALRNDCIDIAHRLSAKFQDELLSGSSSRSKLSNKKVSVLKKAIALYACDLGHHMNAMPRSEYIRDVAPDSISNESFNKLYHVFRRITDKLEKKFLAEVGKLAKKRGFRGFLYDGD